MLFIHARESVTNVSCIQKCTDNQWKKTSQVDGVSLAHIPEEHEEFSISFLKAMIWITLNYILMCQEKMLE